MKQGRASVTGPGGSRKMEPNSRAANPGGVAQIGVAQGGMKHDGNVTGQNSAMNIHAGRGYKAPGIGGSVHKSGSQGKHR